MKELLKEIRNCRVCNDHLPHGPRPVVQACNGSKILVIGQAPGRKVQESGIPWNDLSGDQLRRWLGVTREQFYNEQLFALIPMGFCYPGKGKSGDLPPRPECAPLWHERLLKNLPDVELTILIGKYAQDYYLPCISRKSGATRPSGATGGSGAISGSGLKNLSLTARVLDFRSYLPRYLPLVHPSPRNKGWQKRNPWFATEVVPLLQERVSAIIERQSLQQISVNDSPFHRESLAASTIDRTAGFGR